MNKTPINKQTKNYVVYTQQDWKFLATMLLAQAHNKKVWCLSGDMGSGKTTLVKALCVELGITEAVSSPTYGLIHEYGHNKQVIHFDLYRLTHLQQAIDIGCEEYFESGAYCFIEWPKLIKPLLPDLYFDLQLTLNEDGTRSVYTK